MARAINAQPYLTLRQRWAYDWRVARGLGIWHEDNRRCPLCGWYQIPDEFEDVVTIFDEKAAKVGSDYLKTSCLRHRGGLGNSVRDCLTNCIVGLLPEATKTELWRNKVQYWWRVIWRFLNILWKGVTIRLIWAVNRSTPNG